MRSQGEITPISSITQAEDKVIRSHRPHVGCVEREARRATLTSPRRSPLGRAQHNAEPAATTDIVSRPGRNRSRTMSTFLAKFAVSGAALGGLAVMLLSGADPAEARPKSCLETYRGCTNRCVGRYDDAIPCIQRTCDKQYRN